MVVPSTPLLQDTLLLQFDDIDRFVTSQAPYLEYYNGTISAPATTVRRCTCSARSSARTLSRPAW